MANVYIEENWGPKRRAGKSAATSTTVASSKVQQEDNAEDKMPLEKKSRLS